MSNVSIFEKKWIDLVFEGKNKQYGAYQLRQESQKTTLLAFISGILFIALLSGIGIFFSSFSAKPPMKHENPITDSIVVTPYHSEPETIIPPISSSASSVVDNDILINAPMVVAPKDASEPNVPRTDELPTTNPTNGTEGGTGTNTNPENGSGTSSNGTESATKLPTGPVIAAVLDEQPEFPGGIDKFRKQVGEKFKTPELDEATIISVLVSFVIEKDGTMSDIKVLKNPGYGLDTEAIRVLKSIKTKWKPGKIQGQFMRTQYTLPIKIQLN